MYFDTQMTAKRIDLVLFPAERVVLMCWEALNTPKARGGELTYLVEDLSSPSHNPARGVRGAFRWSSFGRLEKGEGGFVGTNGLIRSVG